MPATPFWLASAEAILNRSIAASSPAALLAQRLDATSLQLEVQNITRIRAALHGGRLSLLPGDGLPPADATITGSLGGLTALLRNASGPRAVQIHGDAEVANLYHQFFVAARPDLEEELSRWVGDFAARRFAGLAKGLSSWMRRTQRVVGENVAEYLTEESRDLVAKAEIEEFLQGVDELRESADRVAQRLSGLELRLQGLG